MAGTKNLVNQSMRTKSEQKKIATMGGKASGEARRNKKTFAEIVQMWANMQLKNQNEIEQLKDLGISGELTNKFSLVLPLLENVKLKGDVKSMQMIVELLQEDREKEAQIRKLELENEKLKKELAGEIVENQITIINQVEKDEVK